MAEQTGVRCSEGLAVSVCGHSCTLAESKHTTIAVCTDVLLAKIVWFMCCAQTTCMSLHMSWIGRFPVQMRTLKLRLVPEVPRS